MSNELANTNNPPVRPGFIKKTGLAARRAEAESNALTTVEKTLDPTTLEHRIGIIFDDSGSMHGGKITDAHEGCEEFLRSCEKDKTSVAIYPMNMAPLQLCANLPAVALYIKGINATGGTYVAKTARSMFAANNLTRAIIFSDGSNGDGNIDASILQMKIPIDTVYIDDCTDLNAMNWLKNIAEVTGGIFLHFKRGQSNFRTAFKYLSPGLRYMLTDKAFVQKLEGK